MSEVLEFKNRAPLKMNGLSRSNDDPDTLSINLNRKPTDSELKIMGDWLDMMINKTEIMQK